MITPFECGGLATSHRRSRARPMLLAAAALGVAALAGPGQAFAVNEPPAPPHTIISFPQRDFVSSAGFAPGDIVLTEAWRNGHLLATSTPVPASDDPGTPGFDGLAEVNHPGGGCWVGSTPDLMPGDAIRTTVVADGVQDQTTTANVTATAATSPSGGTVVVHGTAVAPDGTSRLPIDQIEQRVVANRLAFDLNDRRTLRAGPGLDGTMAYDSPTSTSWTATFGSVTPLSQHDVDQAVAGETRILWLGTVPAAIAGQTIFETALDPAAGGIVGGPSPPCTAPAATTAMIRLDRGLVNVANVGQPLVVDGVATADITGVQLHVGGQPVHAAVLTPAPVSAPAGTGGTWTVSIPADDLANLPQGSFALTARYAGTTAPPDETRALVKDTIAPAPPLVSPAAGRYDTAQVVTLGDAEDGANVFYTNNGLNPTPLGLRFTAPLSLTFTQTVRAIAVDPAGNASAVATFPFTIGPTPGVAVIPGARDISALPGIPATTLPRPGVARPAAALRGFTLTSPIRLATMRARGLRVAVRVGSLGHVVRIRVFHAGRRGARTGRSLGTFYSVPFEPGLFPVTLRARTLLDRMRPGRYVVEVAAGDSRSRLEAPASRLIRVTRR
jgi:Chitobiase/beta-hexosaminidase C-terminal domain